MSNIADNMADESRSWKINRSRVSYPFCEWERRLALIQIYCHLRAGAGRSNTGIMLTQARGIYTKLEVICRGRAQTPSTTTHRRRRRPRDSSGSVKTVFYDTRYALTSRKQSLVN